MLQKWNYGALPVPNDTLSQALNFPSVLDADDFEEISDQISERNPDFVHVFTTSTFGKSGRNAT